MGLLHVYIDLYFFLKMFLKGRGGNNKNNIGSYVGVIRACPSGGGRERGFLGGFRIIFMSSLGPRKKKAGVVFFVDYCRKLRFPQQRERFVAPRQATRRWAVFLSSGSTDRIGMAPFSSCRLAERKNHTS